LADWNGKPKTFARINAKIEMAFGKGPELTLFIILAKSHDDLMYCTGARDGIGRDWLGKLKKLETRAELAQILCCLANHSAVFLPVPRYIKAQIARDRVDPSPQEAGGEAEGGESILQVFF
jgi:hypothetical protein